MVDFPSTLAPIPDTSPNTWILANRNKRLYSVITGLQNRISEYQQLKALCETIVLGWNRARTTHNLYFTMHRHITDLKSILVQLQQADAVMLNRTPPDLLEILKHQFSSDFPFRQCTLCGYKWLARTVRLPRCCPNCNSRKWCKDAKTYR